MRTMLSLFLALAPAAFAAEDAGFTDVPADAWYAAYQDT